MQAGALDQYLKDVSTYPLLSQIEETYYARRARAGDKEAYDRLVTSNLRFVISVAKKFQGRGVDLEDLIAEGNVGLLTAAEKFDPEKGVKFISYAVWWIRQKMLQSLGEQGRAVRIPLNRGADIKYTGDTSFDQPMGSDETSQTLYNYLGNAEDDPFEYTVQQERQALLEKIRATANGKRKYGVLTERDWKIVDLYYGIEGEEHTLEEIGAKMGVTRERIRQLKERALKNLHDANGYLCDAY
jgi:RNA polymerase primary sigma factor